MTIQTSEVDNCYWYAYPEFHLMSLTLQIGEWIEESRNKSNNVEAHPLCLFGYDGWIVAMIAISVVWLFTIVK